MPGTYEFVPNPEGLVYVAELAKAALYKLALELSEKIKGLTPIASSDEHLGTTSALSPEQIEASVQVSDIGVGWSVGGHDWRFHLIEFGFLHQGSEHLAAQHPVLRAAESWCSEHGFTMVPHSE